MSIGRLIAFSLLSSAILVSVPLYSFAGESQDHRVQCSRGNLISSGKRAENFQKQCANAQEQVLHKKAELARKEAILKARGRPLSPALDSLKRDIAKKEADAKRKCDRALAELKAHEALVLACRPTPTPTPTATSTPTPTPTPLPIP